MKFKGARLLILLPFIFSVSAFSKAHFQSNVIELVNPNSVVTGSIPAGRAFNDCTLGETQYKLEFPGGPRRLVIDASANQSVVIYVRRNSPITIEGGNVLSDFKSFFSAPTQKLSLPAFGQGTDVDGTPLLQRGSYFIAITNCGQSVADYTLRVNILDPLDVERVNISSSVVEVGSVPAPEPGFCRLGRTQYAVPAPLSPCGGGIFWTVIIRADQNVNVYVRKDKPVTVENGLVTYDHVTSTQDKIQRIGISPSAPGTGLFFIAIENCNFDAANYTVTSLLGIIDIFPPSISRVFLEKKDLHIVGSGIRGGKVLFDNQPQDVIDGGNDSNFNDVLIIKKAKKRLPRRQPVLITVTGLSCGASAQFLFLRP